MKEAVKHDRNDFCTRVHLRNTTNVVGGLGIAITMNIEQALALADSLVYGKTGKHLSSLQITVFRGAWSGQKYEQIAENSYCCEQHVKRVGATLWELLSEALEEKVSKKSFRASIERKAIFGDYLKVKKKSEKLSSYDRTKETKKAAIVPLKTIQPELPQGPIELGSRFYVERPPIESECYQEILKPGALIRIKAPGDMGKSSLIGRILDRASQEGYHTVYLNFQLADSNFFSELDPFLKWFCLSVGDKLQLSDRLSSYWKDMYGIKRRCHKYFEKYLLEKIYRPVVLVIDEVNYVFSHPVANDFFALLRAWHEQAKSLQNSGVWKKLRLVLSHSTEAYLIQDINQSPFNVGLAIDLREFLPEEVKDLATRHRLSLDDLEIEQLMVMVGGHPYLLQIALYYLASKKMTLSQLLQLAPTEAGPYSSHLRRHLRNLEQQPELMKAFKTVMEENTAVRLNSVERFKLHSMGLVRMERNKVRLRCELYRQYFCDNINCFC